MYTEEELSSGLGCMILIAIMTFFLTIRSIVIYSLWVCLDWIGLNVGEPAWLPAIALAVVIGIIMTAINNRSDS